MRFAEWLDANAPDKTPALTEALQKWVHDPKADKAELEQIFEQHLGDAWLTWKTLQRLTSA